MKPERLEEFRQAHKRAKAAIRKHDRKQLNDNDPFLTNKLLSFIVIDPDNKTPELIATNKNALVEIDMAKVRKHAFHCDQTPKNVLRALAATIQRCFEKNNVSMTIPNSFEISTELEMIGNKPTIELYLPIMFGSREHIHGAAQKIRAASAAMQITPGATKPAVIAEQPELVLAK